MGQQAERLANPVNFDARVGTGHSLVEKVCTAQDLISAIAYQKSEGGRNPEQTRETEPVIGLLHAESRGTDGKLRMSVPALPVDQEITTNTRIFFEGFFGDTESGSRALPVQLWTEEECGESVEEYFNQPGYILGCGLPMRRRVGCMHIVLKTSRAFR